MTRLIGLIGALAACSGTPAPIPEPVEVTAGPAAGDTLMVTISIDPTNVNPLVAPYALGGWIADLVTPGLVRRSVGAEGLTYEPALATEWAWSDDKLALTYTLRTDVVWEDGEPLTADDVVFTYTLMRDPKVASNWFGDAQAIREVTADGPHQVTFHFAEPRNLQLQQGVTIRGIVPEHIFKDIDPEALREHPTGRQPLASGPFRVAGWTPNQRVILEPNPMAPADWAPHLDRIVFRIQPEPATRKLAVLKGEIDLDPSVEPAQLSEYRDQDDLIVVKEESAAMVYIGYNLTQPRWQDANLRRALTLATDRKALIERVYTFDGEAFARPCVSTVGPNLGAWAAAGITPLPYDPAESQKLLTAAGWVDSDQDGIRDKDGEALRVRVMYQNGDDAFRDLLTLAQRQWKDVGVDLQLEPLDGTTFQSRARAKNYDAVLWGFGNNPLVKPSITWHSEGQYNWFGYSNPQVDAALVEGEGSLDLEAAQAAIRRAQELVYQDQPVTFLLWQDGLMVRHKRFEDVQHDTFTAVKHAETWWVPTASQKY